VRAAARYLRGRPDVLWMIFLVGMVGTFGLNFPIVLTAMADNVFHGNAGTYGLFNIILGVGSSAGAVLAGAGRHPRTATIVAMAALFGILQAAGGVISSLGLFLVLLVVMGFVNLLCQAMANSQVQMSVDPEIRGRVMGLYMLAFMGGTPIGAPIVGAITSHYGARVGMVVCGVIPVATALTVAAATARRTAKARRELTAAAVTPEPVSWEVWETLLEEETVQQ
jgi:MFS family permease